LLRPAILTESIPGLLKSLKRPSPRSQSRKTGFLVRTEKKRLSEIRIRICIRASDPDLVPENLQKLLNKAKPHHFRLAFKHKFASFIPHYLLYYLIENRNVKNSTFTVSANDKDPDLDPLPHGSPLVGLSGFVSGTLVKVEVRRILRQ
jgi:hypothetical protein